MKVNLNLGDTQLILSVCRQQGALRNQAAYILATGFWETGRSMKPVKETVQRNHKDKNPSDETVMKRLDRAWKKGSLPWVKTRYWATGFFGRGYVQITHEYNYRKAGEKLGLDLLNNPYDVMKPDVAASILVRGSLEGWFTGKKIGDYIDLKRSDFKGARRVINGTDKAAQIAAIAIGYDAALKADGYGVEEKPKIYVAPEKPTGVTAPKDEPSWLAAVLHGLALMFRKEKL